MKPKFASPLVITPSAKTYDLPRSSSPQDAFFIFCEYLEYG